MFHSSFYIFVVLFSQEQQNSPSSILYSSTKVLSEEHIGETNGQRPENLENHVSLSKKAGDQSENICGNNGIFSHEVLLDGETERDSKVVQCKFKSKVRTLSFLH